MRLLRYCLVLLLAAAPPLLAQPAFTEITEGDLTESLRGWSISWVDFDGDADLDLFASRFATTGGNVLFRNDDGFFVSIEAGDLVTGPGSIGHSWADFDNDGDLDVLTVGSTGGFGNTGSHIRLLLNDGPEGDGWRFTPYQNSPFIPTDTISGWSGAWGDFDNDGLLDFIIAHAAGFLGENRTNELFHHVLVDGSHFFDPVEEGPVVAGLDTYTIPSWSDYDLDGDLDLFIGSGPADGSTSPDNLYRNTLSESGSATFERITTDPIATNEHDGQVMNWIDYDNDGDLDLYVTNYSGTTNKLYRNDHPGGGAGPFVEIEDTPLNNPVEAFSLANTWGDLDNDGDLDVLVSVARGSTSDNGFNRIYINEGDGTFSQSAASGPLTETQESTSGATLGDFDNDGDLDVATTSPSQSTPNLRLYQNDTENGNGWLKLNLRGTASNRSGIGAKVRATATIGGETVTQFREVSAQNTFGGQNALTVHFGLGDAASVATLEITWPSGTVDTFEDVSRNAFFEATEGEGLMAVANEPGDTATPEALGLTAAYPNPFAETATIRYTVPAGPVRLVVFDVLGRRVRTLADRVHSAGTHTATWDGTDGNGRALSAGVYLYRLEARGETLSRSLTLLR